MHESHVADEPKSKLESTLEHLKEYITTSVDILKLKAADKAASMLSSIVSAVVTAALLLFALVFLSIGVAWYLSSRLQNPFYGFFIVGGVYLFLGVIMVAARKSLVETPMSNAIIKQLFKEEKE
jgi:hypothetical protein